MLTVLATLNHVDQEIRVILAINVTFVTVFVIWVFLLVCLHIFLSGKVAEAVFVGTSEPSRDMSGRVLSSQVGCLGRHVVLR